MAEEHLEMLVEQNQSEKEATSYHDEYKYQRRYFDTFQRSARLDPISTGSRQGQVVLLLSVVAYCY